MQFFTGKFNLFTCPEPPSSLAKVCVVTKYQVHDRNVFTLSPFDQVSKKHVLYLHGGAYVQGFTKPHWVFMSQLVKNTHCRVVAPDYPLAPAATYVDTLSMVEDLYLDLLTQVDSSDLYIMGDSAGGGLTLALAQQMLRRQTGAPPPLILLSPWLDISLSNPEIRQIDQVDNFLGIEGLKRAGKAYAGGTDLRDPRLSPIYGSLAGLGKISVFIGTYEIFLADARKLKAQADSQGIAMNYYEYPEMLHVWMFLNFPESKKARLQIFDLIRQG